MKSIPSTLAAALTALVLAASHLMAAPPDLTAGGTPNNTRTTNLGPTGMRGWIYHVNGGGRSADTSESRQILVSAVDNGSPAHGVLAKDDVILGASGTGANPAPFSSDARKSLALAIADAEARNPATLKLLRWRSGTTTTVEITLRTMGHTRPPRPTIVRNPRRFSPKARSGCSTTKPPAATRLVRCRCWPPEIPPTPHGCAIRRGRGSRMPRRARK